MRRGGARGRPAGPGPKSGTRRTTSLEGQPRLESSGHVPGRGARRAREGCGEKGTGSWEAQPGCGAEGRRLQTSPWDPHPTLPPSAQPPVGGHQPAWNGLQGQGQRWPLPSTCHRRRLADRKEKRLPRAPRPAHTLVAGWGPPVPSAALSPIHPRLQPQRAPRLTGRRGPTTAPRRNSQGASRPQQKGSYGRSTGTTGSAAGPGVASGPELQTSTPWRESRRAWWRVWALPATGALFLLIPLPRRGPRVPQGEAASWAQRRLRLPETPASVTCRRPREHQAHGAQTPLRGWEGKPPPPTETPGGPRLGERLRPGGGGTVPQTRPPEPPSLPSQDVQGTWRHLLSTGKGGPRTIPPSRAPPGWWAESKLVG